MEENKRLLSLDILRGFDLFMLVGLQPILRQFLITLNSSALNSTLLYQLDHVQWKGFTAWDLVMPLFLFMSGVTMPFSLPKYLRQHSNIALWKRVLKRVLLLWLFGMIVQGNILSLNPNAVYLYSNTLQAIAIGYLLTVPLVVYLKPRMQIMAIILLLIIYTIPMVLFGDWSQHGNFAAEVDNLVLGRFRDQSFLATDGTWQVAQWYDYTWVWSSITFCCTVALGSIAGEIIKRGNNKRNKTAVTLLLIGISFIILGSIWGMWHPIIKRIWSGSMTIYSAGWCFALLAIFYWWIDVKGHKKGLQWLQFYGCNAITAYMLGEVINFRSIVSSLCHGAEQYIGDWYPLLLTTGNSVILFCIMAVLYKQKIFLKV